MNSLICKSGLIITNPKDYDQNRLVTEMMCALKREARRSYETVKNEKFRRVPVDRKTDPLLLIDKWKLTFDI